jgi:four helix bundle protein
MELAEAVYRLTASLPSDERFGLTSQLRRAAVAIPSNIAEGDARQSRQDYLRFLRMSRGSLSELSTQIEIAKRVELCNPGQQVLDLIEEVGRILNALIRSLEQTEAQQ